jgi:uncharacterized protein
MDTALEALTWRGLAQAAPAFSLRVQEALDELGIRAHTERLRADHVCVRLKDPADVDRLRGALKAAAHEISSVMVNGRIISIFELHEPLTIGAWSVRGIEVPYPKQNHRYEDGWEHIEFVLDGVPNTMDGVRASFFSAFPHLTYEALKTDYEYEEDEPTSPEDQIPNPTISLKVRGVGIKFHARPIQEVVGWEE